MSGSAVNERWLYCYSGCSSDVASGSANLVAVFRYRIPLIETLNMKRSLTIAIMSPIAALTLYVGSVNARVVCTGPGIPVGCVVAPLDRGAPGPGVAPGVGAAGPGAGPNRGGPVNRPGVR
jgi:hypothetical protein